MKDIIRSEPTHECKENCMNVLKIELADHEARTQTPETAQKELDRIKKLLTSPCSFMTDGSAEAIKDCHVYEQKQNRHAHRDGRCREASTFLSAHPRQLAVGHVVVSQYPNTNATTNQLSSHPYIHRLLCANFLNSPTVLPSFDFELS